MDEEGEEEREATQKKGQKKKKKTSKPRGAPKGQPIAYETLCFYIDTIEQQIPKVLRKVPSSDRDAADEALREVVERVSEQLNHQLVRPSKRIDYANLADATKRLESAITANTLLLARLTAEVENKQSDLKEEKQRLARLQEEAEKIERKRAILQKKRKVRSTLCASRSGQTMIATRGHSPPPHDTTRHTTHTQRTMRAVEPYGRLVRREARLCASAARARLASHGHFGAAHRGGH